LRRVKDTFGPEMSVLILADIRRVAFVVAFGGKADMRSCTAHVRF